jgi:hypothetical protein
MGFLSTAMLMQELQNSGSDIATVKSLVIAAIWPAAILIAVFMAVFKHILRKD